MHLISHHSSSWGFDHGAQKLPALYSSSSCQHEKTSSGIPCSQSDRWHTQVSCPYFDVNKSTESNYSQKEALAAGKYAHIRARLDSRYHSIYSESRQHLQDSIIDRLLEKALQQGAHQKRQNYKQWIVFTAGVMGVGKTFTLNTLQNKGCFPLQRFVRVDPDEIRSCLPEYELYQRHNPLTSGRRTQKEAGLIAEVLTHVALERGMNVLVDGSLRDADWYKAHFDNLRHDYQRLQLAIVYITAPVQCILERVKSRSEQVVSARTVPPSLLEQALQQVPKSVEQLRPHVDFFVELHNDNNSNGDGNNNTPLSIATPGLTWGDFGKQKW